MGHIPHREVSLEELLPFGIMSGLRPESYAIAMAIVSAEFRGLVTAAAKCWAFSFLCTPAGTQGLEVMDPVSRLNIHLYFSFSANDSTAEPIRRFKNIRGHKHF